MAKLTAELRVHELARFAGETADLEALKKASLVPQSTQKVKVIASGTLEKAVSVRGLAVTAGARKIIEAAGGSIE
jgi:large subunit ribosomal protein L15